MSELAVSQTFVSIHRADGTAEVRTWADIVELADDLASALKIRELPSRSVVMIAGQSSHLTIAAILMCWISGHVPSVLPLPHRLQTHRGWTADVQERIESVEAKLLVSTDPEMTSLTDSTARPVTLGSGDIVHVTSTTPHRSTFKSPPTGACNVAVQFTSGTTAAPVPLLVDDDAISANMAGLAKRTDTGRSSSIVSWLPLYHDMGLFGCLALSVYTGCNLSLIRPTDFVSRPQVWAEAIDRTAGTYTAAPNFGYQVLSRSLARPERRWDLGSLTCALNGSEQIDVRGTTHFVDQAAAFGMSPTALIAAYGMAETVVATTVGLPSVGLEVVQVTSAELEEYSGASSVPIQDVVQLASVGKSVDSVMIEVRDATGAAIDDGHVGAVYVSGYSMARDASTGASLGDKDGWWKTGDIGLIRDGALAIVGRDAELMKVGGRRLSPSLVEECVRQVPQVRPGGVAAFAIPSVLGTDRLVVVAETVADADRRGIERMIRDAVQSAIGVRVSSVVLSPRGTVAKTTSGKVRRLHMRRQYMNGNL